MLAVCHVVGHDAHDDGAQVEEDIGQDLRAKEEKKKKTRLKTIYLQENRDMEVGLAGSPGSYLAPGAQYTSDCNQR